ncbi:glycerol-3-phosphate 1-O-acyltransferase PlsY [Bacillus sinesaloumensis]|uniref:glycerol-3-phosphate 1-O-acyltransferase PlsY n=1 Tax=Litchfieldia sinesaloumensis TaxID=1926280 RepID=UPI00098875A5|nr:glycerol-3-phosphate 1-O-acyltransferase PlsY [Bacillus sinesaloumensis]
MVLNIVIILLAYLLGSIPSGLIVGKIGYGIDIREHGSGNLGGTNTFRTLGKKAGLIVTIADILKGTLATALAMIFLGDPGDLHPLLVGMVAVVGHMYPIFAGFKGGKAVATSGGVLLAYNPILFITTLICFFIFLKLTKMVSLASMLVAIYCVTFSIVYSIFFETDYPLIIVVSLLAAFVFYRHRANIVRIKNKTEPKIKWL